LTERIVLMGISLGGYLAPRAVAFEKRIKACIANGGVYDFHADARLGGSPPCPKTRWIAPAALYVGNQTTAPGKRAEKKKIAGAFPRHSRQKSWHWSRKKKKEKPAFAGPV
jgi:hypothetical protein